MLSLRGHMLLCLQGFQGKGYSDRFVENMKKVHRQLTEEPNQEIQFLDTPDEICMACPNLHQNACTLHGIGTEADMARQDRQVLQRLGFAPGEKATWEKVLQRISEKISGSDLGQICGKCPWLPLGLCKDGIDQL